MTRSEPFVAPRPSPLRRALGLAAAVVAAVALVAFVVGTWNPWHLVRLQQFCSDPLFGLVVVDVLVIAAFWLLFPVRSEAAQVRRHTTRWLLLVSSVPVLLVYGIFHPLFGVATKEMARSPSGERRAALVTHGDDRQLRIWVGGALTLRDVGLGGLPCGPNVLVRFVSEDAIHVTSVYGDFDIRLDPGTGRPLTRPSRSCAPPR